MRPAAVTDSLLHDLVMSSLAEGGGELAVAAVVTLDDRILLCGRDTGDFGREWDLPAGAVLPGETLTSALDRILACDYGLETTGARAYVGSYDRIQDDEVTRVFVFTASCADPLQICRTTWIAHCWADSADLPEQASQELARLADLAMREAEPSAALPGRWQLTAALRAGSNGMYCDQAAAELLIRHGSWGRLHRAIRPHRQQPGRRHDSGDRLGGGHHRAACRRPAVLKQRSLHPRPSRQPRNQHTCRPASLHHRARPGQPLPRHHRHQRRRRTQIGTNMAI